MENRVFSQAVASFNLYNPELSVQQPLEETINQVEYLFAKDINLNYANNSTSCIG